MLHFKKHTHCQLSMLISCCVSQYEYNYNVYPYKYLIQYNILNTRDRGAQSKQEIQSSTGAYYNRNYLYAVSGCFQRNETAKLGTKSLSVIERPLYRGGGPADSRKHRLPITNFMGFYIVGEIPKDILKILQREYSDKILFDGKKIVKINELN